MSRYLLKLIYKLKRYKLGKLAYINETICLLSLVLQTTYNTGQFFTKTYSL